MPVLHTRYGQYRARRRRLRRPDGTIHRFLDGIVQDAQERQTQFLQHIERYSSRRNPGKDRRMRVLEDKVEPSVLL